MDGIKIAREIIGLISKTIDLISKIIGLAAADILGYIAVKARLKKDDRDRITKTGSLKELYEEKLRSLKLFKLIIRDPNEQLNNFFKLFFDKPESDYLINL